MKLAIMQPYFFPYIGYWQLINAVDKFVIYDNIQYTKKGWINRNRYLKNGKDDIFTISLKKDSDFLNIVDREISLNFDKKKFLAQMQNAYYKAPYIKQIMPLLEEIIYYDSTNLFEYLLYSINKVCNYIEIKTPIIVSSTFEKNSLLKGKERVLDICKLEHTSTYINAIGGQELYDKEEFKKHNIELKFIKTKPIVYNQFDNEFVPNLSIIDVMMFNSVEEIKHFLGEYELV